MNSLEELQAKYDRLVNQVRRMRGHQKEYFKYRASSDLRLAKNFEREVDKIIDEEIKIQKANQGDLFNNG